MKILKQGTSLSIDNHDIKIEKYKKHGPLLPSSIRCLIVGPSNCGKTNVIMSLLEHPNGLRFENVYIFSKSLYQPKYLYLEKLLKPLAGIGYYSFNNNENLVSPKDVKPNSIFIFDDIATESQSVIQEYFSMGRHCQVDCFYLCQTYAKIPKHLIRDNANTLVIFKQDELNLKHIYNDHVGADMLYEQFRNMCSTCWKEKYGFLVILKDENIDNGRYRKGFDHFIYL